MVKELCNRCNKPVYPTDKVGPLKASTFFHQGCFKCYICGTRLALKTYCNNRNNIGDKEVYCNNHVPNPNPHDLPVFSKTNAYLNNTHLISNNNIPNIYKDNKPDDHYNIEYKRPDAGLHDLKIAHAMKATQVAKPYPKIKHEGAKYIVDYDAQTRLELIHRQNEDILYQKFNENRQKELKDFEEETKEEWEKALSDFTRRYEQGQANCHQKDDLIRQLTIKRDKKLETINFKRKERERHQTAELVDQQAKEMLELFRQARNKKRNLCVFHDDENNSLNNDYNSNNNQESYYVDNIESLNVASASYPATPPPPLPPSCGKRHLYTDPSIFNDIDEVAANLAQSEVNTFTQLIRILISGARSDVDKARAIFKWITVKNLNVMIFDNNLDKDTPMGLLRGIKYGTESYHVLFKRLCSLLSYAGLHCVVIKGYSKSAGYQPGVCFDDSARFRNTWNAVFLDGSWRFVQCNWGARHLVNSKDSKNDTLLKDKRIHNFYSTIESNKDGSLRYEYDDHYFMTDPEEFIYEFFPQQSEWQLLPRPITLQQFEQLPFVRSLFFRFGLSFVDHKISSVLRTDKTGAATISITSTNKPGIENVIDNGHHNLVKNNSVTSFNNLIFHYNLRFYDSDESIIDGFNLKRFVMQSTINCAKYNNSKKESMFVFRVHAPSIRPLLLDIFCNSVSINYYLTGQPIKFKSICKFKILCESLNVIMVPLPECASGEWGPAKAFRLFGLFPLTHSDAIINCEQYCEIVFKMLKPLSEFIVTLHKNQHESRNLHKCCKTYIEENKVRIILEFSSEGQYGIDIYTRDDTQLNVNGKQLLTHCCKYLINVKID